MNILHNKKFKHGSVSVALVIVIIAAVILVNAIFTALARKNLWYIDMTPDSMYTLSDTAKDLLAKEFDTDIDHRLDEMRFHRSRVNYITKAEPIGVSRHLRLTAPTAPTVYLPLGEGEATVTAADGDYTLQLPEGTAYAILHFPKK